MGDAVYLRSCAKVTSLSDRVACITQHTVIACLVEKGYLPQGERFAWPRSQKYREWAALVYEAEPYADYLKLEKLIARQAELRSPPAVKNTDLPVAQ